VLGVVVGDLRSLRPLSGLELGPLEHRSDEDLVARTAGIPGCAVARLAWGHLARDGLGR
jgi:hypothetical protein